MPGTLHAFSQLIFTRTTYDGFYFSPHFAYAEAKALKVSSPKVTQLVEKVTLKIRSVHLSLNYALVPLQPHLEISLSTWFKANFIRSPGTFQRIKSPPSPPPARCVKVFGPIG